MTLKTKSVYEPSRVDDGVRVLVARFWPRGVKRGMCDEWRRELAPSAGLLGRYKRNETSWEEFVEEYGAEMDADAARRAVLDMRSRAASQNVTLLCYEPEGARCHRHVLRDMILDVQPA